MRAAHTRSWLGARARALLAGEAPESVLLIAVALIAMALANSDVSHAYHKLFLDPLPWTPIGVLTTPHQWINDALMAVFFLIVGLEIRREVATGELSDPGRRRLPMIAALAGMAAPALCFIAIAGPTAPWHRGWAIPGATDIAFAVGVIALLGSRVPPTLRLFLLTVAIVDDLGAVAIIALLYTASISLGWLMAALLIWAVMLALARTVRTTWPYVVLAIMLWLCVLRSGIHPTVAGVLAGLAIPLAPDRAGASMSLRLEERLQPWVRYAILPLFALANAGVSIEGLAGFAAPLPLAIATGLFVGKQLGVFGAIVLAERLGLATRPAGASWVQLWGVAILCGIGFTMSLFIAGLAFADQPTLFEAAKLGVIGGSLLSMIAGYAVLWFAGRPTAVA